MKVHLRQIPQTGTHLEGEEDCPLGDMGTDQFRCAGPLRYNLDVGVTEGALWANGSIAQRMEMPCVSCLEKFEFDVTVPTFALHTELHGPEVVDLTPFLREDLLLNLPPYPHCDCDGGRVCQGAIRAPGQEEDTDEKREHDWEALNRLKLNP